jgi:tRNA threonylcarbamoyl adenosine modification protein (Sua5/YciO/YrdC/YwlC family)
MIITKSILEDKREKYFSQIEKGAVFVFPSDTIYGLGCNATDDEAVLRLRKIKSSKEIPFSVIAPSTNWIKENCIMTPKITEWVDKLPGPYTYVLKLKNKSAVSKHLNSKDDTIAIRIPEHWISDYVSELGIPITATSANMHGQEYEHDVDEFHPSLKNNVDFIIHEEFKPDSPSDIVHLHTDEIKIIKRRK